MDSGEIKQESIQYMSPVKVGAKGQIVIPKEVRAMFDIHPGDTMMILADSRKGIALERYDVFAKMADAIFEGKGKDLYPEKSEEDSLMFAKGIRQLRTGGKLIRRDTQEMEENDS